MKSHYSRISVNQPGGGRPRRGKPFEIEKALGQAMGCMGMGLDDFCRLTPSEFAAALEAWQELREQADRAEWERTRLHACITISPHVKGKTTPPAAAALPLGKEKAARQKPGGKAAEATLERRGSEEVRAGGGENGALEHFKSHQQKHYR